MTKVGLRMVKCAKCGKESKQKIVYSVNFMLGDKTSNKELLNKKQICPNCNYIANDISHLENNNQNITERIINMEMMSPNLYIENKKNYSITELIKEKEELETKINNIKENITNNNNDILNGGIDSRLKIYESYLEELNKLIAQHNN